MPRMRVAPVDCQRRRRRGGRRPHLVVAATDGFLEPTRVRELRTLVASPLLRANAQSPALPAAALTRGEASAMEENLEENHSAALSRRKQRGREEFSCWCSGPSTTRRLSRLLPLPSGALVRPARGGDGHGGVCGTTRFNKPLHRNVHRPKGPMTLIRCREA